MKKLCVFILFFSTAQAAENIYVNVTEEKAWVSEELTSSSTYQVSATAEANTYTINSSDFKFYPNLKCIYWETPGTSPDDPGTCGRHEQVGWSVEGLDYKSHNVSLKLKNLKTGETISRALAPINLHVTVPVHKNLRNKKLSKNFQLNGKLTLESMRGCAVDNGIAIGEILGEMAYLNLCVFSLFDQDGFTILKRGNNFEFSLPGQLSLKVEPYAYWLVRDYPRTQVFRKDIDKNSRRRNNDVILDLNL